MLWAVTFTVVNASRMRGSTQQLVARVFSILAYAATPRGRKVDNQGYTVEACRVTTTGDGQKGKYTKLRKNTSPIKHRIQTYQAKREIIFT